MKFLKNTETGQVLHWNKQMAKLKQMVPCDGPSAKPDKPVKAKEVKKDIADMLPPKHEPEASQYLSKDEAANLMLEWFGKPVDRVKIQEFYEYAKVRTGKDFPEKMTKLQLATMLHKELTEPNEE